MIKEIKKKIPFEVLYVGFSKLDGFTFLDIELPDNDLKTIESKTLIISKILDELDLKINNYYLNVYSSGTEKEFELDEIDKLINKNILVKTKKHYFDKNLWEGKMIFNDENEIILHVNNKGRFQKLKIQKEQIEKIKTTAKLKKGELWTKEEMTR